MTDHRAAVIRLENAYDSMRLAKRRIADEIKARHRVEQRREIEEATAELEYEFAQALQREVDMGLPGTVIRSDVLRTQDWSRWKYWRDLAGIKPDRVAAREAKEAEARASLTTEWNADHTVLTILKSDNGVAFIHPVHCGTWRVIEAATGPVAKSGIPKDVLGAIYDTQGIEAWKDAVATADAAILAAHRAGLIQPEQEIDTTELDTAWL